jgi:hypothetical protein
MSLCFNSLRVPRNEVRNWIDLATSLIIAVTVYAPHEAYSRSRETQRCLTFTTFESLAEDTRKLSRILNK